MEEVFTGVWQGDGTKFRHRDAVALLVALVAVTGQEAALVGHLTFGDFELVKEGHAVEPVVEPGKERTGRSRRVTGRDPPDGFTHFWFPISNFPGPFLKKFPLIHSGIRPTTCVPMGSGVSSTETTIFSMHGRPWTSVKCLAFFLDLESLRAVREKLETVDVSANDFSESSELLEQMFT